MKINTSCLSIGCMIMAVTMSVSADEAGYRVWQDKETKIYYCEPTAGKTVQDLTMDHLNAVVHGTNFNQISLYHEMSIGHNGSGAMYPIIDPESNVFRTIQEKNPNLKMAPKVTTRVKECRVIKYAFPKVATIFSVHTPIAQEQKFTYSVRTANSKTTVIKTSASRSSEESSTYSANVGFKYEGISGGASTTHKSTTGYSTSKEHSISYGEVSENISTFSNTLPIPASNFFGLLPTPNRFSYEVEVKFESTFSGYVAYNYNPKVNGHHYYASSIRSILNSPAVQDRTHNPKRWNVDNKITTVITKVLSQPLDPKSYKNYSADTDPHAEQHYNDDLNEMAYWGFHGQTY